MTSEPFSFKSQWKLGDSTRRVPGGAGGCGDEGMDYLTPEQWAVAKPPKEKAQTKEMTKEKTKEMTKEKAGGNLKLPTKEKRPVSKGRKPSVSPQRKAAPKPTFKGGYKK